MSVSEDDVEENEYMVVCRSKYGDFEVLKYKCDGDWEAWVNSIKMSYHYETGCNYFQARPMLVSNWLKLDEAHRKASCPDGKDSGEDLQDLI